MDFDSAYMRNNFLASTYGLDQTDFDRMLKDQDGRCAICQTDIVGRSAKGRNKACVDHDHATGEIRGLLCSTCNIGLGGFKDNVRNLASAIVYLQDYGKTFE